jgi:hypothetical protein
MSDDVTGTRRPVSPRAKAVHRPCRRDPQNFGRQEVSIARHPIAQALLCRAGGTSSKMSQTPAPRASVADRRLRRGVAGSGRQQSTCSVAHRSGGAMVVLSRLALEVLPNTRQQAPFSLPPFNEPTAYLARLVEILGITNKQCDRCVGFFLPYPVGPCCKLVKSLKPTLKAMIAGALGGNFRGLGSSDDGELLYDLASVIYHNTKNLWRLSRVFHYNCDVSSGGKNGRNVGS